MKTRTKIALVTGGNRGIGLDVVRSLAQDSEYKVLLGTRSVEEGQKAQKGLKGDIEVLQIDLCSQESIDQAVSRIKEKYEGVHVLVNNAGVLHEGSLVDTDLEKIKESFQVHVLGPICLIQSFLPSMRAAGWGRIVNVSSGWGCFSEGLAGPFAYSTSKAALNAVTSSLSLQIPKNVKINSVCPGWVRTQMGGMQAPRSPKKGAETIVWLARLGEDGPSGGIFRDKNPIGW